MSKSCLLVISLQPPISFRRRNINGTKKERCPGKFWLYLSLRMENSLDGGRMENLSGWGVWEDKSELKDL